MRRLRQLIKKPKIRVLPLALVAVFLVASVATTISTLLPTQAYADAAADCAASGGAYVYVGSSMSCEPGSSSYAIPQKDITSGPQWTDQDQVMSALYERSLAACLASGGAIGNVNTQPFSAADASDLSKWSDGGHGISIIGSSGKVMSALLDPTDDGVLSCDNENDWLQNALSLWQISTNTEALCIFGYYRYAGGAISSSPGTYDNCVNGSGGYFTNKYAVKGQNGATSTMPDIASVMARLTQARNISPTLDKAHTYLLYKYILEQTGAGCGAAQVVQVDKANADQKALLSTDKAVKVSVVEGEGKKAQVVDYIYQFQDGTTKTSTKEIATYLDGYSIYKSSPAVDGKNQCSFMADAMNALASSYRDAVQGGLDNNAATKAPACTAGSSDCAAKSTTCAVGGIGWIVCPVYNLLAGISDTTYNIISQLLNVPVSIFNTDSGTYTGWLVARNVANVGFVIAFLIIIFSQVSSIGVSNYGVKKMLPRLIIAAIMVNASYFVCELAVDISNILGNSIHNVLNNIPIFKNAHDFWSGNNQLQTVVSEILDGSIVLGLGVAAGAAAVFAGVGLILPVLLGAVLGVLVTFLILIGREALIILLVVVSPVAFLAMLLPNTETFFKQWRKFFTAMLVLYPLIALLYGGSRLAGGILLDALGGQGLAQIAAAAVGVVPLVATPFILKGSLNAIPVVGNLASKLQSRANGLVGKQVKNLARETPIARGWNAGKQRRAERRNEKFADSVQRNGIAGMTAKVLTGSKRGSEYLERQSFGALEDADSKNINYQAALLSRQARSSGKDFHTEVGNELDSAIKAKDSVRTRAALKALEDSGEYGLVKAQEVMAGHRQELAFNPDADDASKDFRASVLSFTHGLGLKGRDNRINQFADGGDFEKLVGQDHLKGLSFQELAGQDVASLRQALDQSIAAGLPPAISQDDAKLVMKGVETGTINMKTGDKMDIFRALADGSYKPKPPSAPTSTPPPATP
jgi:hypothetical protein